LDLAPASFGACLPRALDCYAEVERAYAPGLRAAVEALTVAGGGQWPPVTLAVREDAGFVSVHKNVSFAGEVKCAHCFGTFHHLWVVGGTCFVCERRRREAGQCPFRDACPTAAFCKHSQRCAVCERGSSCDECRLHAGDGEAVCELVGRLSASVGPKVARVYLDWDRTCCSTKNGASPVTGGNHTLDESLLDLLCSSMLEGGVRCEIVTRNRHTGDIKAFLGRHGVTGVPVHGVQAHSKDKGSVKAHDAATSSWASSSSSSSSSSSPSTSTAATAPRSKAEIVCRDVGGLVVFADDDILELAQPDIAACPWVHRVHFARGFT
jgi:hypothetical protein